IDFRARTNTAWESFIFCADMTNRYDVALPSTSGEWKWMRLIVTSSEALLYEFGNPVAYGPYSPYSGGYYSLGFAIYDHGTGTIDVDAIYITSGDLEAPTTTTWSATQTKQLDIGELEIIADTSISWDWASTTATVDPSAQNATVE